MMIIGACRYPLPSGNLTTYTVCVLYAQVTSFRVRNDSGAATLTRSASDCPAQSGGR